MQGSKSTGSAKQQIAQYLLLQLVSIGINSTAAFRVSVVKRTSIVMKQLTNLSK